MGDQSYSENSHFQRAAAIVVKGKLNELVTEKFDIEKLSSASNGIIRLADLGAAAGPNTFLAMGNLVLTMRTECLREVPEFHVFFNDLPSNNFNALFSALPSDDDRGYFAAGVAGSFHGRLFPESYLHFVYTSTALHRLSRAPEEVARRGSPAWNKGRVHYTSASKGVIEAYSDQFRKDFGNFLQARGKEVVSGGMVTIIMPGIPDGMPHRKVPSGLMFHLMDECLMDMVKEGLVTKEEVDDFNLPLYTPSPEEMMTEIARNGDFTVEAMELTNPSPSPTGPIDMHSWTMHVRVAMDSILLEGFTKGTIDELFARLYTKLSAASDELKSTYRDGIQLFVVLKRNSTSVNSNLAARDESAVSQDHVPDSYVMNGGEGAFSYAKNSYFQKATMTDLKAMIDATITDYLDIADVSTIRVADLGCSVGPNTFLAMQNVTEAVRSKLSKSIPGVTPEFQVFFSDHTSNDFNTLFMSLPPERAYYSAGVPGSFYGRLFPGSSLHFVYSSYALQWLSETPKGLVNKGRVHCTNASDKVLEAYAAQYRKDMGAFLICRAKEMSVGGIMVLMMPAKPDRVPLGKIPFCAVYELLGLSLMDMAKEGIVTEAQVDLFNLPLYTTSPSEITLLVERNADFEIEKMELLDTLSRYGGRIRAEEIVMHLRAGLEGLISAHFGSGIVDELFKRLVRKTVDSGNSVDVRYSEGNLMFLVLKRKTHC